MSINKLLDIIIEELREDSIIHESSDFNNVIPTLKKGFYRNASPMLKERFNRIGGWEDSTHGDWLSTKEMEYFWGENYADEHERMNGIVNQIISHKENWEHNAASLFRPEMLSVYAGSAYTKEHVYLVWTENTEPEIWVYDTNGESKFNNLKEYLEAYIEEE